MKRRFVYLLRIGATVADVNKKRHTGHSIEECGILLNVRQSPMFHRWCRMLDFKKAGGCIFVVTCGGRSMDEIRHNSRVLLLSE